MAPSSSPPPLSTSRLELASIRALVSTVDLHTRRFLSDPAARKSLQLQCSARLTTPTRGHFEFSDHSVLSNLYWVIDGLEAAICSDDNNYISRLVNSEKMLQIPALLDEEGTTAGIKNRYLVCCSYFYLSLVRKLRGDEWQMTMHLLQSVVVSPRCVRTELAPDLWGSLFGSGMPPPGGVTGSEEAARQQARRYKGWLMYYRVVFYGEAPPWTDTCSLTHTFDIGYRNFTSTKCLDSAEQAPSWPAFQDAKMVYPLDLQENIEEEKTDKAKASASNSEEQENFTLVMNVKGLPATFDEGFHSEIMESFDIRCLQDMLDESQTDTSGSSYIHVDCSEESDYEEKKHCSESPADILSEKADILASQNGGRKQLAQCLQCTGTPLHVEAYQVNPSYLLSSRSHSSVNNLSFSILDLRNTEIDRLSNCNVIDEASPRRSPTRDFRCFSNFSSKFLKKHSLPELVHHGSFARKKPIFSSFEKEWSEESSDYEKDTHIELMGNFEKAVSALRFVEGTGKCEDVDEEVRTIWEMFNTRPKVKYGSFKRGILDQLLDIISTSKQEEIIRAAVSTLLVLISVDTAVIEEIKRKDSNLFNFASALKRNVHEAAVLIYLLKPPPSEIKRLELLPALVDVACNSSGSKDDSVSLPLTPTLASIAMIEILVTAFDYVTNNMHLAAISSPRILAKLVNVAMNKNQEEGVALAAILVRCMRLNGNCKKFLSQVTPVDPFLHLLRSNDRRAKFAALEYFHEILRMPRASAINLLRQIRQQGGVSIMYTLMACFQESELEHRLLAANLLLQLDMLGGSSGKSVFREEAMEVLLESVASEENPSTQTLSAFILSNLGGTYAWTGERYTTAWLVKKAGLKSAHHRNMIRNVDWFDPCLQDAETNTWSVKAARFVIKTGTSLFSALAKGIQSKIKSVSRDCLICVAWIGNEMAVTGPSNLVYSACEILLSEVAHFLHPGSELDERVLACLCIYNYTSGKGKQKLVNFSEGLRESLRRLSGVTWMAEELLKVTNYFIPTKPRVSCVHTQILEVGHIGTVAATALIFYKGQLCAGYSDGSIKVWDIKGQRGMLVWEVKEHLRPITCLTLFEPGGSLLSGSSDKTIRVWKMVQMKIECTEVIDMKEPVQKVETCGDKILVLTQSRGLKVRHATRSIETICKNQHVKSLAVAQGKIYLGCADSSIREVDIVGGHKTVIRAPASSWRLQNKAVNSIVVYRGCVYCAGASVEGSSTKEWRTCRRPSVSLPMGRGTNVQTMAVVEDFMYLNCSSSRTIIQVWLSEKQQQVGRLSAGSKITSLLTANDIVLCGTETGLIKGWIPL